PLVYSEVDVEKECLHAFERRLFECSARAGRAGSGVWGLNVGPLQDHWNPYSNIPHDWSDENFEAHESDLEVSFINIIGKLC
ncbi:hypothetical protein BDQ17DRAFT_1460186, partial [Cyathus striatus]